MDPRERDVLDHIRPTRSRRHLSSPDDQITLSNGAGQSGYALVEALFRRKFGTPLLKQLADSAVEGNGHRLTFSTGSFAVEPLFFRGGDIGALAVNATVNDLAMAGARPLYMSVGLMIEEGFAVAELLRVVESMAWAAQTAGVSVVSGNTMVVARERGEGLSVSTEGVGVIEHDRMLAPTEIRCGDQIIVSGSIGEHGMAMSGARGELELEADLRSDTAPLHGLVATLLSAAEGVRCLLDVRRGGVASALNEVALSTELAMILDGSALPIRREVARACEILGVDPLCVENEGKLIAVVGRGDAENALAVLRGHPLGENASIVGEVRREPPGVVRVDGLLGGSRVLHGRVRQPVQPPL